MMIHVPGVLSADEVIAMREQLLASNEWVDGKETVGSQGAQVKHNLQLADKSQLRVQLANKILKALAGNGYFFAAALPRRILLPLFNRYKNNGNYGMHIDGSIMYHADSSDPIRSDLSCTLFLSNPEDYEGGELVVVDTYGEHDVKLPAGDMILYPSSSLHRVNPVTTGERISSFFWLQSMVRSATNRRLLFELDTAITKLSQTNADRDSVVKITGIYHNLLREWAEV